ncbi:buccalin-like [Mercenaria mercenaria]|uniref:buccalin-like n=1 Tax=Mercenaria mercenaria TaxID=6596 RepID=UPI001E1E1331|nr:buccalin-like [Mercenaria mercenaria]
MRKRCQTINLVLYSLLWLAAEAISINGELTDRSENELKTLSKRDAHDIDMLQELAGEKNEERSLKDLASRIYDIYGENESKRALETADDMDLDNVDKNEPPYLVLEELDENEKPDYYNGNTETLDDGEEKQSVDTYSLFGTLGKRFRAPMGFSGRLGKRKAYADDYDKRIPLGFVGTLGKRAPMGFRGQLGKRAPMGFRGQLGKRAPMGFRGQLGKRAPLGFIGQLGKRAPMGFFGTLGKRDPVFVLSPERRAPMGFRGQLGKRGGPMGFRGQLGKREA